MCELSVWNVFSLQYSVLRSPVSFFKCITLTHPDPGGFQWMTHTDIIIKCIYTFEYQLVIILSHLKTVLFLVSDNQGFTWWRQTMILLFSSNVL